jgi:hypothetical protein
MIIRVRFGFFCRRRVGVNYRLFGWLPVWGFVFVPTAVGFSWFVCLRGAYFWALTVLAFPCFLGGLLALPLCGAALTFFAAAKKDKQRKRLDPPAKRVPRAATVVVHLESVPSHIRRE